MFTTKRSDGIFLRDIPAFTKLLAYIMPKRSEAVIFFEQEFDVTKTLEYVERVNAQETEGAATAEDAATAAGAESDAAPAGKKGKRLTFFQVFLTATVRTIALRPRLNRFIAGCRMYQRNRIVFNFVAKRELSESGSEVNVTLSFSPYETIHTLPAKVSAFVNRVKSGAVTGTDNLVDTLVSFPRWSLRMITRLLFWLDYHNALPFSFTKDLPFFSTVFFTNVGSVGIDAPFHHNFDFGTCGLFVAIGKIRTESVLGPEGKIEERKKVKVSFTYDDRITDGIYCGRAIDLLRSLVEDPSLLEKPPELSQKLLDELALMKSSIER